MPRTYGELRIMTDDFHGREQISAQLFSEAVQIPRGYIYHASMTVSHTLTALIVSTINTHLPESFLRLPEPGHYKSHCISYSISHYGLYVPGGPFILKRCGPLSVEREDAANIIWQRLLFLCHFLFPYIFLAPDHFPFERPSYLILSIVFWIFFFFCCCRFAFPFFLSSIDAFPHLYPVQFVVPSPFLNYLLVILPLLHHTPVCILHSTSLL